MNQWQAIFQGELFRRSLLLWSAFSMVMSSFYFANTWTAKLISDATGNIELGLQAGILVPLGGVCGALLYSVLSMRLRQLVAALLIILGGGIVFSLYALFFQFESLALVLAFSVGVFANGAIAAFYAFSPTLYPAETRATGVGLMIGVARIVSIVTPIGTGYLLAASWKPEGLYYLFGAVFAISSVFILFLDCRSKQALQPQTTASSSAQ